MSNVGRPIRLVDPTADRFAKFCKRRDDRGVPPRDDSLNSSVEIRPAALADVDAITEIITKRS